MWKETSRDDLLRKNENRDGTDRAVRIWLSGRDYAAVISRDYSASNEEKPPSFKHFTPEF